MFSCFGGKAMKKKDDEDKKKSKSMKNQDNETANMSTSRTEIKMTRTEQTSTTITTESHIIKSSITGNTFPRVGGTSEKKNVTRLTNLFSRDVEGSKNKYEYLTAPVKNPSKINMNYKSPYKSEKDATPFMPISSTSNTKLTSQPISPYVNRPFRNNSLSNSVPPNFDRKQSIGKASNSAPKEEKLKIVVKKNKKFYDVNNKIPVYSTHGRKRGSLLLINNILFKNSKDRKGAEVDEKNLKDLFEKFDFSIDSKKNLTRIEMMATFQKYAQQGKLKQADINLVIIMSHGQGDKSGVTKIFGIDDKGLSICEILDKFNDSACPYLKDKPKMFMFMCCRGDNEAVVETDASVLSKPSKDMLLAYSTSPGFVSYRNPVRGTFYTRALCEIFMEHACDTHVEDLLKMVEEKLGSLVKDEAGMVQISSYENRGFKACYLHPK